MTPLLQVWPFCLVIVVTHELKMAFIDQSTQNFCLDNADNDVASVDSSVYGTSRTAALAALHTPDHPKANTFAHHDCNSPDLTSKLVSLCRYLPRFCTAFLPIHLQIPKPIPPESAHHDICTSSRWCSVFRKKPDHRDTRTCIPRRSSSPICALSIQVWKVIVGGIERSLL